MVTLSVFVIKALHLNSFGLVCGEIWAGCVKSLCVFGWDTPADRRHLTQRDRQSKGFVVTCKLLKASSSSISVSLSVRLCPSCLWFMIHWLEMQQRQVRVLCNVLNCQRCQLCLFLILWVSAVIPSLVFLVRPLFVVFLVGPLYTEILHTCPCPVYHFIHSNIEIVIRCYDIVLSHNW